MFIHGHDNIDENILSGLVSYIYSSSECFNDMVSVLSFHLWPENKWPRFNNKDLNLKRWLDTRDNHCLPLSLSDSLTHNLNDITLVDEDSYSIRAVESESLKVGKKSKNRKKSDTIRKIGFDFK